MKSAPTPTSPVGDSVALQCNTCQKRQICRQVVACPKHEISFNHFDSTIPRVRGALQRWRERYVAHTTDMNERTRKNDVETGGYGRAMDRGHALHARPTLQCTCMARHAALTDRSTKFVNQIAMLIVEDQDVMRRKLREYLRSACPDVGSSKPLPFEEMTALLRKTTDAPEEACA